MGIFDRYDRCYREGVEIGFCQKGKPCPGEYPHPGKIKNDCLRCNHLSGNVYKKTFLKRKDDVK